MLADYFTSFFNCFGVGHYSYHTHARAHTTKIPTIGTLFLEFSYNVIYNYTLRPFFLIRAAKVGSCVLSNTCMGLGVQVLSILELRGTGVTWTNFALPISNDDSFSFIYVFGMLLLDTVVYMLLAW